MDYSLVVGVDQEKRELVVGIVDYIRTFTWDKKLESWVKDSTFLGGAKGEPTIVTPKQCEASITNDHQVCTDCQTKLASGLPWNASTFPPCPTDGARSVPRNHWRRRKRPQ